MGWLYALACLVVPLAALVLVLTMDDTTLEPATVRTTEAALMQPVVSTLDDTRRIPLALQWGAAQSAPTPAMEGLVSDVRVRSGDTVKSGTSVLTVGRSNLVATAEYFPEPVTARSDEADTARLARFLLTAGHLDDAAAGWQDLPFRQALRSYQRANGLPEIQRFDPSWTVWLPDDPFVVHEVEAGVGRPLPPVGEPLLRGPPLLTGVRPDPAAGDVLSGALGIYAISLGGTTLAAWDLELPVPPELVAALQQRLGPATSTITVEATLQDTSEAMTVPVSAIVTDDAGKTCLVDQDGQPIPVRVVGSSPGAVDLAPIEGIPPVRIEPAQRPSCGG